MPETIPLDAAVRDDLRRRLKSIEGQARGIQRMLDEGRDCHEIMDQLAALRAASTAAGLLAFHTFAQHCLQAAEEPSQDVAKRLTGMVAKLTR